MNKLEEKHKQRILGVLVLAALAVIFLPSLFYREQAVEIVDFDAIPPKPTFEPVQVNKPIKPNLEELTQKTLAESQKINPKTESSQKAVPFTTESPKIALNDAGVPEGWIIQVASLKLRENAESLVQALDKDHHKAYIKKANTEAGVFFRVYVGPLIDQSRTLAAKAQIDKAHQVDARILPFDPVSVQ